MAITTTTISKAAGFARSDVITQLEEAFTWLGWNGSTRSGIVTGISAYSGGGTVGSSGAAYEDVRQSSTTGVGTDASFYITRSSGNVTAVYVNRPGYGYTDGEYVTISAENIGGSGNGAVAIGITVKIAGNASPVGYGTTTAFYDKDVTAGATYPWGVARHQIQANKKYGDTYRGFQVSAGSASAAYTIAITNGSGFHPWDTTNTSNRGNYYSNRFAGASNLDLPLTNLLASNNFDYSTSSVINSTIRDGSADFAITSSNGNSYGLDLNIYRSGLDPNFAVFSYKQSSLSSTHLTGNTFFTFFVHNFTTNLWDLDELFLGGLTLIAPTTGNTNSPEIEFITYTSGISLSSGSSFYASLRSAETGYERASDSSGRMAAYGDISSYYLSNAFYQSKSSYYSRIYYRNNSQDGVPVGANSNFNAVIKGIPLSTNMIPCPYYLPDDFVLIDFDYATPGANIQQGDTITISGSEVYTVITGSYNQTTRTRGILFCARTV